MVRLFASVYRNSARSDPPMSGWSAFRHVTAPASRLQAWGCDRIEGERAVKPLLAPLTASLGAIATGASILDIGCGGGHLLVSLAASHRSWTLTGIDSNLDQVRRACLRGTRFGDRFAAIQGSAGELPFASGSFDVVVSITSIKHWPDQETGLREAMRVLRPDGRYFVAEVHRSGADADSQEFVRSLGVPTVLRRPASTLFRKFVLGAGWRPHDADGLATSLGLANSEVVSLSSPPLVVLARTKRRSPPGPYPRSGFSYADHESNRRYFRGEGDEGNC